MISLNDYFISWSEVINIFGQSESTIRRRIKDKLFPESVHPIPGSRGVKFKRYEIEQVINGTWKYGG
tara:strand:+ start:467 stop:667 length:201 start_codon:yes stop_codon:yes gene_type:complete